MTLTLEFFELEALQLSALDRARLIGRLIASLDIDPEAEEASAAGMEWLTQKLRATRFP